jgi:hypothetical protein
MITANIFYFMVSVDIAILKKRIKEFTTSSTKNNINFCDHEPKYFLCHLVKDNKRTNTGNFHPRSSSLYILNSQKVKLPNRTHFLISKNHISRLTPMIPFLLS